MRTETLRAPFPYFGGKTRAAALIWEGLGDVRNYVEPFCGSLAVMLNRPTKPRIETVNDLCAYIANFWRAVAHDPHEVAEHADWPVNEADLHARHRWLVDQGEFRERMRTDPEFYDPQIAGWWAWGISCWIGGGWCAVGPQANGEVPSEQAKRTQLVTERGVHKASVAHERRRPRLGGHTFGSGVHQKLPQRICNVDGRGGKGVHGSTVATATGGVGGPSGDWKRVLTPAVLNSHGGPTGIVLDPPYDQDERADNLYSQESAGVSAEVRSWAIEHGDDPSLRIVLCGYEGEHAMPPSWRVVEWHTSGGYASAERGVENRFRERLWFSPACLIAQRGLFEAGAAS